MTDCLEQISIECRETKTKVITLANQKVRRQSSKPISKLEVIPRSRHKAQENVHARATIGSGFTSDWLKKWRENFKSITEWSNAKPKQFTNYFRHSIATSLWSRVKVPNSWSQAGDSVANPLFISSSALGNCQLLSVNFFLRFLVYWGFFVVVTYNQLVRPRDLYMKYPFSGKQHMERFYSRYQLLYWIIKTKETFA